MSRSPAASPRLRLTVATLAALVALLSMVPVALTADLPPDVVTDGTVTVAVSDPTASGAPLEGVTVTLRALRQDLVGDPLVQELVGLTEADGRVVFDGVARSVDGAPPVTLDAQAAVEVPTDCGSRSWTGSATAVAAQNVDLPVAFDAGDESCVARVIEGVVVDAAGGPFPVASATATIVVDGSPTETQAIEVGPDGAFAIRLKAVGDALVGLTVESPIMTVPGAPGCDLQVIERAVGTWDVPAGASLPEQTVVAERTVLASTCGTTGTPGPAAPAPTLPPTDAGVDGGGGAANGSGGVGSLLTVTGIGLLGLAKMLWIRRRPVRTD